MDLSRKFLGWKATALDELCHLLFEKYTIGQTADMTQALAVLPTQRASARLLELLVATAEKISVALTPPIITTVGRFPEFLYRAESASANELTELLAWIQAIHSAPIPQREILFGPKPESDTDPLYLDWAKLMRRLHGELAGEGHTFADIITASESIDFFHGLERWQALDVIQRNYLENLSRMNLSDCQFDRLQAIRKNKCSSNRDIFILATVDLNGSLRKMISQVASKVQILVNADQADQHLFDEYGCVAPDQWEEFDIEFDESQIVIADRPLEQAAEVAMALNQLKGKYRTDQITLAVPNDDLIPFIHRRFEQHKLKLRHIKGKSVTETSLYTLLESVANYLDFQRFDQFASVVRHPAIYDWVSPRLKKLIDPLTELDKFQNRRLPVRMPEFGLSNNANENAVKQINMLVEELLEPLMGSDTLLGDWSPLWIKFIEQLYRAREFDKLDPVDAEILKTVEVVFHALKDHQEIPESIMPKVSAARAIRLVMDRISSSRISAELNDSAIDATGWLDILLDDAPVVVVTGFNEGIIPSSESSHLILPDAIREALGYMSNSRRYARDAFILQVLTKRCESLTLVAGRNDTRNSPLSPSRLMFATDEVTVANRTKRFFDHQEESTRFEVGTIAGINEGMHNFVVPKPPEDARTVAELSVTAFKNYLRCPYRFYLTHVLKLGELDDREEELPPNLFGNVLHDVLEGFGKSAAADSTSVTEIRKYLDKELNRQVRIKIDSHPRPAVTIQIEQIRQRLWCFARSQAAWRNQGWQIRYAEKEVQTHKMMVDGEYFPIIGRLDRVDVHEDTGEIRVFDYKSFDKSKKPRETHIEKGKWVDLQLPIYHHLVRNLNVEGEVKSGYICLPRDLDSRNFEIADWTEEELATADTVAEEIIRRVKGRLFWPPADPPPVYWDEFAGVCLDSVFDKPVYEEHEDGSLEFNLVGSEKE